MSTLWRMFTSPRGFAPKMSLSRDGYNKIVCTHSPGCTGKGKFSIENGHK